MEDEEEDDSEDDSETGMDEDQPKEKLAGPKAADARSSDEDMQDGQQISSDPINPADLKRLRDNVEKDLGQVSKLQKLNHLRFAVIQLA